MGDVEHHPTASIEPPDALDSADVGKQVEARDGEAMRKSWEDIEVTDDVDEEHRQDAPIEPPDEAPSACDSPAAQNVEPSGKSTPSRNAVDEVEGDLEGESRDVESEGERMWNSRNGRVDIFKASATDDERPAMALNTNGQRMSNIDDDAPGNLTPPMNPRTD